MRRMREIVQCSNKVEGRSVLFLKSFLESEQTCSFRDLLVIQLRFRITRFWLTMMDILRIAYSYIFRLLESDLHQCSTESSSS